MRATLGLNGVTTYAANGKIYHPFCDLIVSSKPSTLSIVFTCMYGVIGVVITGVDW